ncbi:molybdopterin oxidoreductase family protein [Paralcaligenes sp. KSB-10]|uniref:molybdopterin oxidoreductase family protein n=1 Tax=Paralcaligenes sp. KSB-10 TaxID=2901142 RepID=UPI001E57784A|nr:molybdopterin oxidoreductase family protein [Paralcaligenes sp. KSB-10]UHL64253.1 molybdopterin oxidoreductase family protein [Paralcaligenes sp. KSB-10]
MQSRIDSNLGIAGEPDEWVHSACVLCSNGCGLDIAVKDGRIAGVRGSAHHPVNFGHLGPKGLHSWVANNSKRRGTTPMIRRKKGEPLQPASWPEAMDFFIERFTDAWKQGHQNLGCYNSGQLTLEELYTLGKLWRGGLRSSNIDGNTRLCTATSATGLMANFGTDGPVASYVDIDQADLLCLYGHNVAEAQTVLWERMLAAKRKNGGRIIVADPRKTPSVRQGADLHLQLRVGTNVALMNGIVHLLIERGWVDREFVAQHTVGFAELETVVREYPPERVADICGIGTEDLQTAAEWIGTTPRMVSTVLQGFYQSVEATASSSMVNTVHLLTGAIGRPGAGPLLMAGQPSAMCNRETGAGGSYPAYRNPHSRAQMMDLCEHWNLDSDTFRPEMPKDILSMMEMAERGEIEFMWVVGTNPLVSLPDQNRTERILRKLFLVVQDPFIDAETVDLADIYFPAAMWGEKAGCITNADRSVNLLLKAVEPPGQARSDFEIFAEVANSLGFKDRDGAPLISFAGPRDAFEEWRKVSKGRPCDYSGMTYELILEMGAVRWPCNEQHPRGSERLYGDLKFWTGIDECESYGVDFLTGNVTSRAGYERIDPKGKAFLRPVHWRRHPNPTSEEYPFILNTGRVVYHFHTRTKTARSSVLNQRAPHPYVEIHPTDAARLRIGLGDMVEITSPNGRWEGVAMVVDTVRPGEVFVPFHYGQGAQSANQHTWYARDPVSHQPQLKSSPAAVRRISFGQPQSWLLARLAELNGEIIEPFAATHCI